tara:strand:+ start:159 stop:1013 length:855 start_codon:yes stop_codon:yes gene_type:complete
MTDAALASPLPHDPPVDVDMLPMSVYLEEGDQNLPADVILQLPQPLRQTITVKAWLTPSHAVAWLRPDQVPESGYYEACGRDGSQHCRSRFALYTRVALRKPTATNGGALISVCEEVGEHGADVGHPPLKRQCKSISKFFVGSKGFVVPKKTLDFCEVVHAAIFMSEGDPSFCIDSSTSGIRTVSVRTHEEDKSHLTGATAAEYFEWLEQSLGSGAVGGFLKKLKDADGALSPCDPFVCAALNLPDNWFQQQRPRDATVLADEDERVDEQLFVSDRPVTVTRKR